MRSSYLITLLIVLIGAGTYWYQSTAAICPAPLAYRLGDIDPSFDLTREQALAHVREAEAVWENETQRELFRYDDTAEFTVDFIFDERQATANSEEAQREALDTQRSKSEEVLQTVESLQAQYQSLSASYESRVVEYEERLDEYNAEVNQYNDRGGAPADVFTKLEQEREGLNDEADKLTRTASELSQLAAKINTLGERGNELVETYNEGVNQYNSEFGFAHEFTQGDYQGGKIHVYKFSNEAEVITVLAHEFGHALGIDHVEGDSSLMYYLLEDTSKSPILSGEDLAAYVAVCGTAETFEQKVRRAIREVLTKF